MWRWGNISQFIFIDEIRDTDAVHLDAIVLSSYGVRDSHVLVRGWFSVSDDDCYVLDVGSVAVSGCERHSAHVLDAFGCVRVSAHIRDVFDAALHLAYVRQLIVQVEYTVDVIRKLYDRNAHQIGNVQLIDQLHNEL